MASILGRRPAGVGPLALLLLFSVSLQAQQGDAAGMIGSLVRGLRGR